MNDINIEFDLISSKLDYKNISQPKYKVLKIDNLERGDTVGVFTEDGADVRELFLAKTSKNKETVILDGDIENIIVRVRRSGQGAILPFQINIPLSNVMQSELTVTPIRVLDPIFEEMYEQ